MGNIVSTASVPTAMQNPPPGTPVTSPQSGVPPTPPSTTPVDQDAQTLGGPAPITIEGIEAEQPAGFHTDPFGPLPTPELPDVPDEPELPSITPEPPPEPAPLPPITPLETQQKSSQQSAAELLTKMPDVQQMMKDLEKSGCLLPELQIKSTRHIDSSPLAALQPQQLKDQSYFSSPTDEQPMKVLPEVQLASTRPVDPRKNPPELPLYVFVAMFGLLQSIQGLTMVAHFIFVRYPEYEQMIVANVITTSDADTAVVKAIIVGIAAAIGFLFSLLLLIKRSKNRSVDIYIVISIVVINFLVQNILSQKVLASGNPLQLPDMVAEIMASRRP